MAERAGGQKEERKTGKKNNFCSGVPLVLRLQSGMMEG
jgi:hypothetical protein